MRGSKGSTTSDWPMIVAVLAPRRELGHIKGILDKSGLLHETLKVQFYIKEEEENLLAVPTNDDKDDKRNGFLERLRTTTDISDDIRTILLPESFFAIKSRAPADPGTTIRHVFDQTLYLSSSPAHVSGLTDHLPKSYTIYGTLLLFPSTFPLHIWTPLLPHLEHFFTLLSQKLKVSHIATNAPIPLSTLSTPNTLRSPTSLTPLYGDFGPLLPISRPPSATDFDQAFWTSTKQNGITQTWAPRYTMFSAGNIKEKTRLLRHASVAGAVQQGRDEGTGSAAVDLYVGIGYFAFSYLKAGVDVVLGWDLNPWSIEGTRRGAGRNGWRSAGGEGMGEVQGERLVVFCEDNVLAMERLGRMKGVPPVRHVNLGLLPSSRGAWLTAVQVLDRERGGWLHVHENFGLKEIEDKAEEVRRETERLVLTTQGWGEQTTVKVEEVFRVKSYAPGVWHCVIDLHVDPNGSSI
ncbi:putative tRNA wybutosine-synthesizing protein [Elsinoe fawcettii]|nr:putative tRNA wybutosine-synthesizing protein [Elsinoe fawcettii]